ncbi:Bro-N domain-containing protein [Glaesserella parasuis]|nr:Bro-N domain-containing protein [Glaesserella parasuis]
MTTLTFQNTTLSVINKNNHTFLTANDLGTALEYADPTKAIVKIYDRNADEFTAEMTALIELQTAGGKQQVRVFSLRGAHLIAMFARTKVAKDFRKWVLDILDREISQNEQQIAPLTITLSNNELYRKRYNRLTIEQDYTGKKSTLGSKALLT